MTEASMADWERLLAGSAWAPEAGVALAAALEAGATVRDLYERAAAATYAKADGSPVTDADLASDAIVRRVLGARFPADAILTEEGRDDAARLRVDRCWIVDPIDGTQQFVERTGNFDVLVALAVAERPVVGVALQPPTGTVCLAVADHGSWVGGADAGPAPVRFPADPPAHPTIASSVWFGAPENGPALAAVAARLPGAWANPNAIGVTPRLFVDPRSCDALLGFRLGSHQHMAHEWDLAVADLFVHEAGGRFTDLDGNRLRYNQANPSVDRGLVIAVHPDLHERLLAAVRGELVARRVPGF